MNEEQRQKERSPKAKLLYVKQHKTNRIHAHGLLGSHSNLEEIGQLGETGSWRKPTGSSICPPHPPPTKGWDEMYPKTVLTHGGSPTQQQMGVTMKAWMAIAAPFSSSENSPLTAYMCLCSEQLNMSDKKVIVNSFCCQRPHLAPAFLSRADRKIKTFLRIMI